MGYDLSGGRAIDTVFRNNVMSYTSYRHEWLSRVGWRRLYANGGGAARKRMVPAKATRMNCLDNSSIFVYRRVDEQFQSSVSRGEPLAQSPEYVERISGAVVCRR